MKKITVEEVSDSFLMDDGSGGKVEQIEWSEINLTGRWKLTEVNGDQTLHLEQEKTRRERVEFREKIKSNALAKVFSALLLVAGMSFFVSIFSINTEVSKFDLYAISIFIIITGSVSLVFSIKKKYVNKHRYEEVKNCFFTSEEFLRVIIEHDIQDCKEPMMMDDNGNRSIFDDVDK